MDDALEQIAEVVPGSADEGEEFQEQVVEQEAEQPQEETVPGSSSVPIREFQPKPWKF